MSTRADVAALVLGVTSAAAWLLSYSWLLWAVLPLPWPEGTEEVSPWLSPWFVAEVAAVVLGLAALAVALASRPAGGRMSRRGRTGAVLGGAAACLALLSLAA